jgi:hypothetical protein
MTINVFRVTTSLFGLHFEFTIVIQTNTQIAFLSTKKFSTIIIIYNMLILRIKNEIKILTYVE